MWAVAKPGTTVKSLDDFRGKTIATLRFPSSTIQTPTFAMKDRGGFDPESAGVKFLQFRRVRRRKRFSTAGPISRRCSNGTSVSPRNNSASCPFCFADIIGPLSWTTAMVTRDLIAKEPALVQAFCDALAEAQAAVHSDRELFVKTSVAEFPQVSEAVIRSAAENLLAKSIAIPKSPTISKQEWDADMAFELAGGSIKTSRPYEEMVDNSFAERAAAKVGKAG